MSLLKLTFLKTFKCHALDDDALSYLKNMSYELDHNSCDKKKEIKKKILTRELHELIANLVQISTKLRTIYLLI